MTRAQSAGVLLLGVIAFLWLVESPEAAADAVRGVLDFVGSVLESLRTFTRELGEGS